MHLEKNISMVGVHAEGEIGKVIVDGVSNLPGKSMMDKMNYLNNTDDSLRRYALFEPRGFAQMTVNLLMPPTRDDADAAFIPMQPDCAHPLSGSNCMCVTTAILETGIVEMKEPETIVTLDTPAGLVKALATCHNGKCESVSLDMVPSFVVHLDYPIEVEGLGTIKVDIAYGGCFFALVDSNELNINLQPTEARKLVDIGGLIKKAVTAQIPVCHPEFKDINTIDYVIFTGKYDGTLRNCNIMYPGRIDRSPCGTGSSARLAVMYARKQIHLNEEVAIYSMINSRFLCQLIGETEVGGIPAVIPRISGRSWVYSQEQYSLDPTDPYPLGFAMSDTWGPDLN